jgi:hypothetical protein
MTTTRRMRGRRMCLRGSEEKVGSLAVSQVRRRREKKGGEGGSSK